MQVTVNNPAFNYYYSALPLPVLRDSRLKDRDRRLLAAFYFFAGKTNRVYNKTRKELGYLAGMAEDVVTRISTRLTKFGWIKKSGNGGRSQSATYELTIPEHFTHLQRPVSQKRSINTTKESLVPIAPQRISATQKTAVVREGSLTLSIASPPTQDKSYPLSLSLTYPNGLDQHFANTLLIQLPNTQQQVALDEWLGQVNSYKERAISIHSPNGLFRAIIKAILAGNSGQHASLVKLRRERTQMIVSVIEQPAQKNEGVEQSKSPAKRFAPGEIKAKLMAEIDKLKQNSQEQKPEEIKETPYALPMFSDENPVHLVEGQINIKPTKTLKTTTTVTSENTGKAKEHAQKSGGGNVGLKLNSVPNSTTNPKTGSVGPLADKQSQRWSLLTKFISSCGFVEEPPVQSLGRGQLTSCPPQLLSSTSSTRPDALRLPKQINNIFSYPLKDEHAQKVPIHPQYGSVSSEPNIGIDEKMSRSQVVREQPAVYRDIPCCQRTTTANQAGNRTKKLLSLHCKNIVVTSLKWRNMGHTIKQWFCR